MLNNDQSIDDATTYPIAQKKNKDSKSPKQILVTNALVDFVAGDLMPLSIVESDHFKKLVNILDPTYQLPSKKYLSTELQKKCDHTKRKLLSQLAGISSINLTLDVWFNSQTRSCLGITGHFITESWTLKSVMVGCSCVTGRHNAENIILWYDEIIAEFGIRDKVKHTLTDSACNIKKAFLTLPGFEYDMDDERSDSEDKNDDDDNDNQEAYEAVSISFSEDITLEHHSCFAHTLELVVQDGLNRANQIDTVIKRCSDLVSFTQRSVNALDGGKRVQNYYATSWSSQLKMMRSVLSIPESMLSDDAPKLSPCDRNILCNIIEILTPFEEAIDSIQVDCIPSAGYVLPCIKGLAHHLQGMDSKYYSTFVDDLKSSLERRMPYYERNETYVLAAILDPRFKLRWCSDNSKRKKSTDLLKAAVERKISLCNNNTQSMLQAANSKEEELETSSKKRKTLFEFMPETDVIPNKEDNFTDISTVSINTDKYLEASCISMDSDPTKFWKDNQNKFPFLSMVAKEVLSVPASSVPVEKLFNNAGKVFSPERCRLSNRRFEQLMFLRCNN